MRNLGGLRERAGLWLIKDLLPHPCAPADAGILPGGFRCRFRGYPREGAAQDSRVRVSRATSSGRRCAPGSGQMFAPVPGAAGGMESKGVGGGRPWELLS